MLHRWVQGALLALTLLVVCNLYPLLRELGTTKEILARNAREEGEEN